MTDMFYPVPTRSKLLNRRICSHEIGHALISRAIGDTVHEVSVIPDRSPGGYEGRCVRSGPATSLALDDGPAMQPDEVISLCERLDGLTPEIGATRIDSAEFYVRGLNNVIALVAGEAAELVLHPDLPPLGTQHDFIEAAAFAKITVIASPAVEAMIQYGKAEATAIIAANIDIARALVDALEEAGALSGEQVDAIIGATVAARAADAERVRRKDWKARQRNAETFQRVVVQ